MAHHPPRSAARALPAPKEALAAATGGDRVIVIACVRIQWDPERGLRHEPLGHRSIQIGLTGEAVARYADEWIISLTEETWRMQQIRALLADRQDNQARALLPDETPYPLPPDLGAIVGATPEAST
jgi:hypothetical protein